MSNGAQSASGGATYRMLRELGSRAQHSYAAIREPHELVVVQRFVRVRPGTEGVVAGPDPGTPLDAEAMALLLRDARCLAKNWHPNIARVRHVDLAANELTIATELLEGATLADLALAARPERTSPRDPVLALPILVRVLLDVLGGLHALHGLRDGMNTPVGAIHGELCPANVVIGKDGVTRIVNALRRRPVRLETGSEAVAYAPPDALDGAGTADPRSDVYAVGVMLWEGLAGRRLYEETDPARVLARQREGDVAPPVIHPSSPFARLVDTAMRALSFDPALRFRGPAEMAAEMRKIAGTRLASGSVVAARVADLAGDAMRMRRATLEPALSGTRRRASERSVLAAEASVAAKAQDEAQEKDPARARPHQVIRKSRVLRASPRHVAPTLATEIPVALIKASRRPSSPDLDEPMAVDADIEGFEDDDELPGPRGSSPELDVEALLATRDLPPSRRSRRISPSPPTGRRVMQRLEPSRSTCRRCPRTCPRRKGSSRRRSRRRPRRCAPSRSSARASETSRARRCLRRARRSISSSRST
jgi:serine/threonine-protein kinase